MTLPRQKNRREVMISSIVSWNGVCVVLIVMAFVGLLSGCSTFVSQEIGDTTYSVGIFLDKEVKEFE
jgi:hypothetical protein